ncbi:MAG: [FeFe] hydrogenase H-cluster maturation GTPase HydF [Candidatus Omnitrophica bacterium]|nr:[FeFe] hydrogenase H-cluster maturation GTPase HydF [Candidatus Omnitrophota bacterium]
MKNAPKSLRLQIGIFGRTNVGKSSFLNMVCGQDFAITSHVPGTTTDVVEKTMELLPVGPVVFLDTAGVDDTSTLSGLRVNKGRKIFDRSDIILMVTEPEKWEKYEDGIIKEAEERRIPVIAVINKSDIIPPTDDFIKRIGKKTQGVLVCSSLNTAGRDDYVDVLKQYLIGLCPEDFMKPPVLAGSLVPENGMVLMIVPIDMEAPRGRIILPLVQMIRETLDNNASAIIVKETGYLEQLGKLTTPPDLVICDSQVVARMVEETPPNVACTTFSIVFAGNKGDLAGMVAAVAIIKKLKPGDNILIAEACSHHPIGDDIGRIKIPEWLEEYVGGSLNISTCAGRDFPEDIESYKLIIHCGGCMITRREMLSRLRLAGKRSIPMTNYGVCISYLAGVLERVLSPFPDALKAFKESEKERK